MRQVTVCRAGKGALLGLTRIQGPLKNDCPRREVEGGHLGMDG